MKRKCKRCKIPIEEGVFCSTECKNIYYEELIEKQTKYRLGKLRDTIEYGIHSVKKVADGRFWATSHKNCFKCSIGKDEEKKSESEAHIRTKFERYLHHRKAGRTVYTELRLKAGMGRPDLVVVGKGFIFAEEIVSSEKEASLIKKKKKYPFPISIFKIQKGC